MARVGVVGWMCMLACMGCEGAAAQPKAAPVTLSPAMDTTDLWGGPWGQPSDGIAMRLSFPPEKDANSNVLHLLLEVRNVSTRRIILADDFHSPDGPRVRFRITYRDGSEAVIMTPTVQGIYRGRPDENYALPWRASRAAEAGEIWPVGVSLSTCGLSPDYNYSLPNSAFKAIEPGQVWRIPIDLDKELLPLRERKLPPSTHASSVPASAPATVMAAEPVRFQYIYTVSPDMLVQFENTSRHGFFALSLTSSECLTLQKAWSGRAFSNEAVVETRMRVHPGRGPSFYPIHHHILWKATFYDRYGT